jgi:hypothetical protein
MFCPVNQNLICSNLLKCKLNFIFATIFHLRKSNGTYLIHWYTITIFINNVLFIHMLSPYTEWGIFSPCGNSGQSDLGKLHSIPSYIFFLKFYNAGDPTQHFAHSRQELYHWTIPTALTPYFLFLGLYSFCRFVFSQFLSDLQIRLLL